MGISQRGSSSGEGVCFGFSGADDIRNPFLKQGFSLALAPVWLARQLPALPVLSARHSSCPDAHPWPLPCICRVPRGPPLCAGAACGSWAPDRAASTRPGGSRWHRGAWCDRNGSHILSRIGQSFLGGSYGIASGSPLSRQRKTTRPYVICMVACSSCCSVVRSARSCGRHCGCSKNGH
jgi:hypothetical protein